MYNAHSICKIKKFFYQGNTKLSEWKWLTYRNSYEVSTCCDFGWTNFQFQWGQYIYAVNLQNLWLLRCPSIILQWSLASRGHATTAKGRLLAQLLLLSYYSSKWSNMSSWTNRSNQHATIRTPGIMLVAVAKRRCQIPQIITLDSIFAGLKYRCNFSLFSRYGNVSAFRWVNVIALGSTVTYW